MHICCSTFHIYQNVCVCILQQAHFILLKSELLNNMATKQSKKCQNCSSWLFSRGAILVLASSALLYGVHWFVYFSIKLSLPEYLRVGFDCAHYVLWVLLPVSGWVAESWLGRYQAIVFGLIVCTITFFLLQVAFMMLINFERTPIPAFVLAIGSLVFGTVGIGSFYTNMLPFTLDQMIGASAEKLTAAVHWYFWGYNIPLLVRDILPCAFSQLHLQDAISVVFLTLGSLSLSAVLIMDCLFHKWLDTQDKTANPIKLIFRVLNYARKNRCPRLRSAFTYIDEEQPSRLDFGKHKFGGPFTEEEVEDVKTLFRLTPLLIVIIGPFLSVEIYDQFGLHSIKMTKQSFLCLHNLKHIVYYSAPFFLIPVSALSCIL